MSPREQLQQNLACKLMDDERWDAPFGVLTSSTKKFRSVVFGRKAILDAEIRIYNPTFMMVRWTTANRSFPNKGYRVFDDATEAMFFVYELGGLNG